MSWVRRQAGRQQRGQRDKQGGGAGREAVGVLIHWTAHTLWHKWGLCGSQHLLEAGLLWATEGGLIWPDVDSVAICSSLGSCQPPWHFESLLRVLSSALIDLFSCLSLWSNPIKTLCSPLFTVTWQINPSFLIRLYIFIYFTSQSPRLSNISVLVNIPWNWFIHIGYWKWSGRGLVIKLAWTE